MATYKYCAFTYTTPNDEHEGQYGVDIVAQEIQYGEYGVVSNIGPAIHAWYGQMPSRGPKIQPPGTTTPRTSPPTTLQRPSPPPYHIKRDMYYRLSIYNP